MHALSSAQAVAWVENFVCHLAGTEARRCLQLGSVAWPAERRGRGSQQVFTVVISTLTITQAEGVCFGLHGLEQPNKLKILVRGNGKLAFCGSCGVHGHAGNCKNYTVVLYKKCDWAEEELHGVCKGLGAMSFTRGFGGEVRKPFSVFRFADESAQTEALSRLEGALADGASLPLVGHAVALQGEFPRGATSVELYTWRQSA